MRILFTGATSLAGRTLARRLRATGHEVVSVSRTEGPDVVVADLADDDLASKLPNTSLDALIHFAATVPANEASCVDGPRLARGNFRRMDVRSLAVMCTAL